MLGSNSAQHLIRSSLFEHYYSGPSTIQHQLTENSPVIHSNSSSLFPPTTTNAIRLPPPRYQSPPSNIERFNRTLSPNNDSLTFGQHSKPLINNPPAGFDRKFSRLLYGQDNGKNRRLKQKRKAFSDPVK
jgi:hypothetical protein